MNKLAKVEKEKNITLPQIYKDFYRRCSEFIPQKLIGTDLFNNHPELNEWAAELLKENNSKFTLANDDFVFLMHQGYIFWYFKADGNPDPDVFGYYEGKVKPDFLSSLSIFIKENLD